MKVSKDKVKLITLGCSKNLVDSEFILSQLKNNDVQIVDDENEADNVIINTCGFIEKAKEESINTILKAVKRKEAGLLKKVYVTGCLSDRYKPELEKDIPEVDKYFGATDKKHTIISLLNELGCDYKSELLGERELSTLRHFAYLKISEGCNNPCSFCAIPIMRGKHKSKPLDEILKEAQILASKGVKEIIIIGQDTTYWGFDLDKKRNIANVLNEISNINGIEWIRLMYAYPSRFPDELIKEIRDNDKICKYIDIPVQHITDDVLKSMRRGITKKTQADLLNKIRNEIPEIAIRTTLITGYPDETEKDFEELKEYISDFKFDRLGVFTYSNEEGTYAANIPDRIPYKEKLRRQKELLVIQKRISEEKNKNTVGKELKVLIDRMENDYYIGRSYKDAPEVDQEIFVSPTNSSMKIGEFYNVRIYDYEEFDLFAEVI
ncbi:MAG TPA: 30S ribosomal protein S12 methylthiotransferase RimO [Ignavibacteria bacterium]|nr:30S ribosomal protein S12 methylthiotransferase RimO [Ignavibacteria bacterium]